MKKVMPILILTFFFIGIFISCEKEPDPITLSEYVIDEWYYCHPEETGCYIIDIEEDQCTVTFTGIIPFREINMI
jgi:hypothetical protein